MLLFFILGLAIIGLGVYAKIHSNRMYKLGITQATVVGHQPAFKKIGQTEIPCTQVTLEIPVEFGIVSKTVLDNGTYNVGDVVDIYYDPERDTVEFPKNISHKDSMGPYAVMAFGALICVLILIGNGIEYDGRGVDDIEYTSELMLNEDGYSMDYVLLPEDERYYEYYYVPADKEETYTYNVKIYDYGIGVVTIFPNESTGKAFNQVFSFYLEYENLEPLIKDRKKYDFAEVAGETENPETAEGTVDYEYLYYYDGKERVGSGGYGVESEEFDTVVEHIKAAVPRNVWEAVKEEMRRYYE